MGSGRLSPAAGLITHGIRANWRQFGLLVAVNAFVGGMVGLERSILPVLAKDEFGVGATTAVVSFVATFALAKALTNLVAGNLSERYSRRSLLIAGWLIGLPVPLIVIAAPSWGWIIAANALLGLNQGLCWSMTVNMKLDLAGPDERGAALGLNEAAGYLAVAAAAFLSGAIADSYGLRPEPFYLGIAFAAAGLALSVLFVRDTSTFMALDQTQTGATRASLTEMFAQVTWRRAGLFGITQAGFVNNLNDALAWGIFPLLFAQRGMDLGRIGVLAAVYPLVWAVFQIATGRLSDTVGRRPLITTGMLLQASAVALVAALDSFFGSLMAVSILGVGTAMVYPTLLAAVSDHVSRRDRATALGVYRFWRDGGAIAGALGAGVIADALDFEIAVYGVAAVTAVSGIVASVTLRGDSSRSPRGLP